MPFKSEKQQQYVMAILSKNLPRRLAKAARLSLLETSGLKYFKYSPQEVSLRTAFILGEGDRPGGKKIHFWDPGRKDSGDYQGHYNKNTKSIWVRNNKVVPDGPGDTVMRLDLTPRERKRDNFDIRNTLKHEIGHHVWEKLPHQTKSKLMRDDDFRSSVQKIMRTEGKHYLDMADTEAFARMYTDTRGTYVSRKQKQIPYYQHSRKLIAHVLRTLRKQR